MKMAIRMPDTMKIERDEIDENDWTKSPLSKKLLNILTLEEMKGCL
jgi:hypothetical protein